MSRCGLPRTLAALVAVFGTPAVSQEAPTAPAGQPEARPPIAAGGGAPAPSPGLAAVTRAPLEAWRAIVMAPGTRETIQANPNVSTRIQFPGRVTFRQVSTPGLWDSAMEGTSVWIRPTELQAPDVAGMTGLTVFTEGGRTYDFLIGATAGVPPSCVLVVDYPTPAPPAAAQQRGAPAARGGSSQAERLEAQRRELEQQLSLLRRQVIQQAEDRIREFRYSVHTRYAWKAGRGDSDGTNLVTSVYDDGRFTYVRIATSAFGIPSVSGSLDGKDVLLQYEYDDLTGVFTVQGLYDRLRIRIGTHLIDVTREG